MVISAHFRNMKDRDLNESGYIFEEVKEGSDESDTEEENSHGSLNLHPHQETRRLRGKAKTFRHLNMSQRIISNSVDYNISTAIPFYSKSIKTFTVSFRGRGNKEAHCAHDFLPNWIYYSVTLGLYGAIITASCLIKEVEIVIKFIGSLANSTLNFTFPGIFFFVIMTRAKHVKTSKIDLISAVLLAVYGVVMGFGLTGVNVWTTISPIKFEETDEVFFTE